MTARRRQGHGPPRRHADTLVVSARTAGGDTDAAASRCSWYRAATSVTLKESRTIDNLRTADIRFSDVRVGPDALLGREGEGYPLIEDVVDYATALLCAEAVGAIRYANEATLEYLKTRRQFGVPIGSFQALQHRMVEMLISYEQARSMACLALREDRQRGGGRAPSRDLGRQDQDRGRVPAREPGGVQLHGGMGMTEELKVSHTFRRLTMLAQTFGDAEHHLERFAATDTVSHG